MTTRAPEAPLQRLSPGAKARLALEVVGAYAGARRRLARSDLPSTLETLRAGAPEAPEEPPDSRTLMETARLANAVRRVLRPLPVDSRCLSQSLVLTRLLARRGIGSRLVIGVKPGAEFGAHAWVELGGLPMLPSGGDEFARLVDL